MLSQKELERYDRHLKLKEVGLEGQLKLKQAKVLVVGAGGLGCPILQYLTAAGVGTIGIVEDDTVDFSNLQRQILYGVDDVGKPKIEVAINRLKKQNPFVSFVAYSQRLTNNNVLSIFELYDIVVDGTDNFSTRYLINDACVLLNKPLVYGAIHKFEGQIAVFNLKGGATYRCLFPKPPTQEQLPNCSEVGVLGVLPGVVGTMQATEVLKIIIGLGTVLNSKLQIINLLNNTNYTINVAKDENQIAKVLKNGLLNDYDFFCEIKPSKEVLSISVLEAKKLLEEKENIVFLDVRESWEQPQILELNTLQIPVEDLEDSIDLIPKDKKVIVFCQTGGRSRLAIEVLKKEGAFTNLYNLEGGILAW